MAQEKQKSAKKTEEVEVESVEAANAMPDEVLDEIDKLLEANAEEFVANYVQKGGQ